ncbi:MAG: S41 family peptidase [Spirochaetaceae bacterium]|jgi:carboxyl-terminal processing protease|nr:S41 family peptidase [Spirochaetaceae bacterium]
MKITKKSIFFLLLISVISVGGALFAQGAVSRFGGRASEVQSADEYTQMMQYVYELIQNAYVENVDPQKLYQGAIEGMFKSLNDPYSMYLPPEELSDLNENIVQGEYGGVGLYISKRNGMQDNGEPWFVEVASPIEDSPGWKAGIKPGDLIVEVEGKPTDKMSLDDTVALLKGPPNTKVTIKIRRGKTMEFPVSITRAIVEVPTVKYGLIGTAGNSPIGYLHLLSFSSHSLLRCQEAIDSFKRAGYTGLILDLRGNYGGLLNASVDIAGLFLSGDTVVTVKSRNFKDEKHKAGTNPIVPQNIPIVVLIDESSASASEILAGALKDRKRAYLVGTRSYGKGSVQQVWESPSIDEGYRITVARYYTPSDVNIDKIGIPPDMEVKFPEFTEADEASLQKLMTDKKLSAFAEANPKAGAKQIEDAAAALIKDYPMNISLMRRLLRDEVNRTEIAPIYDMDYDVQLQAAVKILQDGSYNHLLQNAKTLKQLQDEAVLVPRQAGQ